MNWNVFAAVSTSIIVFLIIVATLFLPIFEKLKSSKKKRQKGKLIKK